MNKNAKTVEAVTHTHTHTCNFIKYLYGYRAIISDAFFQNV